MNKDLTPASELLLQLVLQAATPLQLTANRNGALSRGGSRGGHGARDPVGPPQSAILHLVSHGFDPILHLLQALLQARPLLLKPGPWLGCSLLQHHQQVLG